MAGTDLYAGHGVGQRKLARIDFSAVGHHARDRAQLVVLAFRTGLTTVDDL